MGSLALPVLGQHIAQSLDIAGFRDELAKRCAGEVRFDRLSRGLYSTDASVYQIVPLGVVLPWTEDDVIAVVQTCARFGAPLTARGGGTSQAGQSIGAGVVLDCSKYFNQVLEINAAQRWVRVRPGCILDDLNREVAPFGLQFAPDISTSSRATIGGMIANNSSGTHSIVYGKTIDHVLDLRVVLSDGSVITAGPLAPEELESRCAQPDLEGQCYRKVRRLAADHQDEIERRYPKILRRVGGYNLDVFAQRLESTPFNLASLFVGSEGTLGVAVEAKLRLVELPKAKALLVVQFPDLLDALAATPAILKHKPAAVEVMDKYILDSTRLNPDASRLRSFLEGDPAAILIIEFYANHPDKAKAKAKVQALEADLRALRVGTHFLQTGDPQMQRQIWKLRTLALGLSMAEKGDAKAISFVEDTAVSPDCLRDYIAEFREIIARHGTTAGVYAHASVGCLHVRPIIDLKTELGVRRFRAIAEEVADLVLKYHGALSGEHGDGLVRSPFQEKMFGPALYSAFRELKRTFDPQGLLNPGKIVDAPPLTDNLRFGPAYTTPDTPTTFDFSLDGGLTRSAELCAGVGECRKKRGGSMCPSFRATADELHSTRGRANALRLALTGQCDLHGLTDPALFEAFDLCLECKACKSECPTNVDMARLKAEFLHQYYARHGLPWRNRVFGRIDLLSRWGSRLARLSNWGIRSRLGRWLNDKLLGIEGSRRPPAFARRSFTRLFADQISTENQDTLPHRVLFFPDTFTNYYQPAVGLSAAKLLRRAGCAVSLGPAALRCCGRPMISNGLLDRAVEHAKHNVANLYPWAATGAPIVACEPSCLLTIKDDYPALLRGESRRQAEAVAAVCFTLEELLDRLLGDEPSTFRPGPERILVQGHCHQRSLVGMSSTMSLLRRIPGAGVVDLDAGCCGMAGSFGYEKEHYEVSRLVGEQQLFPALRAARTSDVVVASGFSCKMQIEHFCGRTALHTAELLAELL